MARRTKRTPKLSILDRIIYGFLGYHISEKRLSKIAIIIKPSTILKFHQDLVKRKYKFLLSRKTSKKYFPKYLNSDNDPLFTYHRWQENLRILEIEEIKSVPYTPPSHPFVERLIGTVRRELLDQILFWNEMDLEKKLKLFQNHYNNERGHLGIEEIPPAEKYSENRAKVIKLDNYRWKKHCRGLFQLLVAA